MTHHQSLLPLRGSLVRAADEAARQIFKTPQTPPVNGWKPPDKAQFSHLIGVCNSAACGDEIELYLRYQASRDKPSWPLATVQDVIRRFGEVVKPDVGVPDREGLLVAAWRLYAVYLARAFTYEKKIATDANTRREPSSAPISNNRPVRPGERDTRPPTHGKGGGRR